MEDSFYDLNNAYMEFLGRVGGKDEILSSFLSDQFNREVGNTQPDTSGADGFFISGFLTERMSWDFAVIEQDFMDHCREKLYEFDRAGWYGGEDFRLQDPETAVQKRILRLIYNGAKLGDGYCRELMIQLYKLYHKKEYNQLKRFSYISAEELFSLSERDETGDIEFDNIGLTLGMCTLMGIRMDEKCSVLYRLLEKKAEKFREEDEEETEFLDIPEGLFNECLQQVEAWEKETKGKDFHKANKTFWENDDFIGMCLKKHGYSPDYAYLCDDADMGLTYEYARTLMILKMLHQGHEYTFKDVQNYAGMHKLAAAIANIAGDFEDQIAFLTGDKVRDVETEDSLYKPGMVKAREDKGNKPSKALQPLIETKPDDLKALNEEYQNELADIRRKLNMKEQENLYLREQNKKAAVSLREKSELVSRYESERDELIALREFAYRQKMDEDADQPAGIEEMKAAVADKKIVIIGGHVAWITKVKQQFPEWMFIHTDAYKTVDGKMLDGKEMVYFFTDYMSHVSYTKFIAAVRERKIPFGYLGSRNLDNIIRQVYEDLC